MSSVLACAAVYGSFAGGRALLALSGAITTTRKFSHDRLSAEMKVVGNNAIMHFMKGTDYSSCPVANAWWQPNSIKNSGSLLTSPMVTAFKHWVKILNVARLLSCIFIVEGKSLTLLLKPL